MKLYPYYRLVKVVDGKVITGQELYEQLKDAGFTIPKAFKNEQLPYPPAPYPCSNDEYEVYYYEHYLPIKEQNQLATSQWFAQFEDFAQVLDAEFEFARLAKVDSKQVWLIDVPIAYTYERAAAKLMGKYNNPPSDPVKELCFGKLG